MNNAWNDIDGPALLAVAGGLQLRLDNVHALVRLQRMAAFAARLPARPEARPLSSSAVRRILDLEEIGGAAIHSQEDPFEGIYVIEVPFFGGTRLVMQGQATSCGQVASVLLKAIFRSPPGTLPEGFLVRARAIAKLLLDLSDFICRAAALTRGAVPGTELKQISVPSAATLRDLSACVQFTSDEVFAGIPSHEAEYLKGLLVQEQGDLSPWPDGELLDDQIVLKPLIRTGDKITVASPSELMACLRHHVILEAHAWHCEVALADALCDLTVANVTNLLDGIADSPLALVDADTDLVRLVAAFDTDKTIDVIVLTDDLCGYDPASTYGRFDAGEQVNRVNEAFDDGRSDPEKTLRLIVYQGIGRDLVFGIPHSDRPAPTLFLSIEDLETILQTPGTEKLSLWYFARASEKLHQRSAVVSFSTVDLYSTYREHKDSFYTSDGPNPTAFFVQVGHGQSLRVKNFARIDRRHVVHPRSQTLVEAFAMHGRMSSPVYQTIQAGGLSFFVDLEFEPAWVHVKRPGDSAERGFAYEVGEAVGFWIWQMQELAPSVIKDFVALHASLEILVEDVRSAEESEGEVKRDWLTGKLDANGSLALFIHSWPSPNPEGPANAIDRSIVEVLVRIMAQTGGQDASAIGENRRLVDLVAPPGHKQMIHLFGADTDPFKWPGHLEPARWTQDSVASEILDDLGAYLSKCGVDQGEITPQSRISMLNGTVTHWLIDQLTESMMALRGAGLLQSLVARHEALVSETAREVDHLGARLACFGAADDQVNKIAVHQRKSSGSLMASRFLIEYATSIPPNGSQPLTLEAFDRLLGLASEIINKGMLSDAIKHHLSDAQLSILPSGRLGTARDEDGYHGALASFGEDRAQDTFASALEDDNPSDSEFVSYGIPIEEADRLAKSEFGFSYTEFAAACGQILSMANEEGQDDVLEFEEKQIALQLHHELGWSFAKVSKMMALVLMAPRASTAAEFWSGGPAVFPWRFNRDASYLRRPLLGLATDEGTTIVCGRRNLWQAPGYWLEQFRTGRLQGTTPEMKSALNHQRNRKGELFEGQVAERLTELGYTKVRRRLRRVGRHDFRDINGRNLGDIDVVAVHEERRELVLAEAKDLEVARTPAELANEVEKLVETKSSAVVRLSERANWIQEHLQLTLITLGIPDPGSRWNIIPVVVVNEKLVSEKLLHAQLPIVSLGELESELASATAREVRR
ncbi:hypothetical protein QN357_13495 [Cryobacterium sp. RTC2.1]|uniref:hypothetical protein n=1 Tax=Cryobacterium sp. RTC2.1 TaxID=3048634 RepID=UPI002B2315C9|nr:hypothetical protein [Cryobacterium sp. RTC2.1]MEB0003942.1 hypothetical protein [Cryobacterium sp. RTC2.1]